MTRNWKILNRNLASLKKLDLKLLYQKWRRLKMPAEQQPESHRAVVSPWRWLRAMRGLRPGVVFFDLRIETLALSIYFRDKGMEAYIHAFNRGRVISDAM